MHTPAPWKAYKWANGWEVCAIDDHYTVAKLSGCNNAEANAQLIASAPDLLDALKRIINCRGYYMTAMDEINAVQEIARAAIKKAETK